MSYYMGDYMPGRGGRGDYYRGDPGLRSFFGGIVKRAVGMIPGVGPIVQGAMDIFKGGGGSAVEKATAAAAAAAGAAKTAIIKHPVLSAAAGAGAVAAAGAGLERMVMGGGARAKGHVLRKCGQTLKSGKIGKCHRRMNPCNVHALRRASRRAHAFLKISRRLVSYYTAKKPKGRAYIRHRKRSK